jgi:hypothetical protein
MPAVTLLRKRLWNTRVGGMHRYEGDSYGGGNLWPRVTLWLAIFEATCREVGEVQLVHNRQPHGIEKQNISMALGLASFSSGSTSSLSEPSTTSSESEFASLSSSSSTSN